jgi:hypothetical protein
VLAGVTERTRLALLDHVTSQTGLVLPIRRLVRELDACGVDTLVTVRRAGRVDLASMISELPTTRATAKWLAHPGRRLHVRADLASACGRWSSATVPTRRAPTGRAFTSSSIGSARTTRPRCCACRRRSASWEACCLAAGRSCADATGSLPCRRATSSAARWASNRRAPTR